MKGMPHKFYSVYDRHTDMPVIIHEPAKECAEKIGITLGTLRSYVSRTRKGNNRGRYDVFEDEIEEGEEDND